MNCVRRTLTTITVMLAVVISGCSSDRGTGEKQDSDKSNVTRGEHARDRGGDAEGEESGTELDLNETYNEVRNGARLILTYDAQSNSFNGTVQNTTEKTLERVRVEVHLSNGTELGPTIPADLGPGEKRYVTLMTTSKNFDGWSAHAEVGNAEHGGSEEGGGHGDHEGSGEHGSREGGGEHDRREGSGEHGSHEGSGEHN
ncbi:MAG: FxLYD domain-containing protein [Planctomycetota bacterium]